MNTHMSERAKMAMASVCTSLVVTVLVMAWIVTMVCLQSIM